MSPFGSTGVVRATSARSKQRTTSISASVSLMWPRNLFPSPSPRDAPEASPAMSTTFTLAGTIFCVSMNRWMISRRSSGTSTSERLGSTEAAV